MVERHDPDLTLTPHGAALHPLFREGCAATVRVRNELEPTDRHTEQENE
jgi:hypothetical protein